MGLRGISEREESVAQFVPRGSIASHNAPGPRGRASSSAGEAATACLWATDLHDLLIKDQVPIERGSRRKEG